MRTPRASTAVSVPAASAPQTGGAERVERNNPTPWPIGVWLATCGLLLLLTWLMVSRVFGVSELGQDGFLSVDLGAGPLREMLAFTVDDVHPPLFYAILHAWFGIVGVQYVVAKFVVIASSVLCVAAFLRLGKSLLGAPIATLAALALIVSPTFLRLSTTERDFVPGLSFTVLSLVLAVDLRRGATLSATTAFRAVGLAIITAGAMLMSYFHLSFLVLEALLLVWPGRWGRSRAAGIGALIVGVLLAAPWYAYFIPRLLAKFAAGTTGYAKGPTLPTWAQVGQAVAGAVTGRAPSLLLAATIVLWFGLLAFGIAVTIKRSIGSAANASGRTAPLANWPLSLVVLGGGFALGFVEVFVVLWRWQQVSSLATYLVVLLPFVATFQAIAVLTTAPRWRAPAAVALCLAVAGGISWYADLVRSTPIDWTTDAPLQYVATHVQPGDALVFSDHARRAQYMLLSNWKATLQPPPAGYTLNATANGGCNAGMPCAVIMTSDATEAYLHATPQQAQAIINALPASVQRIWHLESGEAASQAPLGRLALDAFAYPLWHQTINATQVWLYITAAFSNETHPHVILSNAVSLDAYAYTQQAKPGGTVAVRLVWRSLEAPPSDYTVFVHLDDRSGHLQAQQDMQPVTDLRPTSKWKPGDIIEDHHALQLPPNLAPGDYNLNVGLYQGNNRLAEPDGTNAIQLGVVHVER